MAEYIHILEDVIATGSGADYLVEAHAELHDDEPEFDVQLSLRGSEGPGGGEQASFQLRFTATDHMNAFIVSSSVAGAYAYCVGKNIAKYALKKGREVYKKARQDNPDSSVRDCIKEAVRQLGKDGQGFRDAAQGALLDCIPFSSVISDSDGDD